MNRPKQLVTILALLLALVMLFSAVYIVLEADHDCGGEDCLVCAQLRACEELLRNLLLTAALLSAAGRFCALIRVIPFADLHFAHPHTLIALKVKLSD
jgi:hypothetical protein